MQSSTVIQQGKNCAEKSLISSRSSGVIPDRAQFRPADARNSSNTAQERFWYALYTFSNQEKRVEKHLQLKGVEVFLPLYKVTKRWKNRTTAQLELPVFAGYMFVKISAQERVRVLEAPAVVSLVGNGRELLPIADSDIEKLRAGLRLGKIDPHAYLKVGVRARIRSGPFMGMEGVVVRKDDQLRVVMSIDSIMRSYAVHVHAEELETCLS